MVNEKGHIFGRCGVAAHVLCKKLFNGGIYLAELKQESVYEQFKAVQYVDVAINAVTENTTINYYNYYTC